VSVVLEASSTVRENIGSALATQCVARVSVLHEGGGARTSTREIGCAWVASGAAICRDLQRADPQDHARVDAPNTYHKFHHRSPSAL
jgi:hypothetical protein